LPKIKKIDTGLPEKKNKVGDETEEEMKRKKTRKERGTRKETNYSQQKEKPIGRYNERNKLNKFGTAK